MGPSAREVSSADHQEEDPAILAWPTVSKLHGSTLVAILILLISFHFDFSVFSSFSMLFFSPIGRTLYV